MKALLAALPVAFAALSSTKPQLFDAEHMLETFKAIAAQKVAQGGDITKDTKENIKSILKLIESNLTTALAADYQIVMDQFRVEVSELQQCNVDVQMCKKKENEMALGTYMGAKGAHCNCRAFEHETCHYNKEDCEDVHGKVKGFNVPVWGNHDCDDEECGSDCSGPVCKWMNDAKNFVEKFGPGCSSSDPDECYFSSDAGKDGKGCTLEERKATECSRDARVGGGSRLNGTRYECCDYASCRSNCLYATGLYARQAVECKKLQRQVEDDHCSFIHTGCDCCNEFSDCWTEKSIELKAYHISAKQTIDLIHVQQEALECLVCYGNQILNADTDDFSKCERAGCVGCVDFPDPCITVEPAYETFGTCTNDMHGRHDVIDGSCDMTVLNDACPVTFAPGGTCLFCNQGSDSNTFEIKCERVPITEPRDPENEEPDEEPKKPSGEGEWRPEPEKPSPEGEGEPKKPVTPVVIDNGPEKDDTPIGETPTPEGEPKKPVTPVIIDNGPEKDEPTPEGER